MQKYISALRRSRRRPTWHSVPISPCLAFFSEFSAGVVTVLAAASPAGLVAGLSAGLVAGVTAVLNAVVTTGFVAGPAAGVAVGSYCDTCRGTLGRDTPRALPRNLPRYLTHVMSWTWPWGLQWGLPSVWPCVLPRRAVATACSTVTCREDFRDACLRPCRGSRSAACHGTSRHCPRCVTAVSKACHEMPQTALDTYLFSHLNETHATVVPSFYVCWCPERKLCIAFLAAMLISCLSPLRW